MNDDMKMILFSDLHYLDDNHKEKTNRKSHYCQECSRKSKLYKNKKGIIVQTFNK